MASSIGCPERPDDPSAKFDVVSFLLGALLAPLARSVVELINRSANRS